MEILDIDWIGDFTWQTTENIPMNTTLNNSWTPWPFVEKCHRNLHFDGLSPSGCFSISPIG